MLRHRSSPFLPADPVWRTVQARNAFGSARNRSRRSRYLRPELPNPVTHRTHLAPKLGGRVPWLNPSYSVSVTWVEPYDHLRQCDCAQVRDRGDLELIDAMVLFCPESP